MEEPGTIVVGTDGSETAERAVDRAGMLARALGVTVHVVSG
jgi:nucleotide-binding universal stress UspA family protein